ncbi:hypothetical protein J6S55_01270 [Candidatus Saccharibacteria bacterium]|nr:hypothetical protein [Candidatus Saccharibacteria bacterium]
MKKFIQKILPIFATCLMGIGLVAPVINTAPAYADGKKAAILEGCYAEGEKSENGAGIICVINLVIDILSVLIGVVGVIGIVIVGIQYLTAGGNEEQTRKAKRRLFEIVIGLMAYVLIYALLKWLLPGFSRGT